MPQAIERKRKNGTRRITEIMEAPAGRAQVMVGSSRIAVKP
jgi:hypothetical protein